MTKRKRFNNGQLVIPGDMLGKLSEEDLIAPMVRPFFQGVENEFAHINTEAEFLKWLIETYGSKTRAELTPVENNIFDAVRARSTVNIYSGLERILFRISIEIDEFHPEGTARDTMEGKRDALERLSIEMPVPAPLSHRAAVISKDTRDVLNDLMRFRRAERGCYTFQLKELDLAGSAEKALGIVAVVKADVDRFKINLARQEYS